MGTRTTPVLGLALVVCLLTSAQALIEAPRPLLEPWSGWWWPGYHAGVLGICPNCPHLWRGGDFDGPPGPIYDHDTRYFWLPEPDRYQAQAWEYDIAHGHRTTDPQYDWIGHCNGASCAQALELDPPTDCGALSQDDLEGLLSEIYMDCGMWAWTAHDAKPSDMWLALRKCLGEESGINRVMVIDFSITEVWDWPVYGYRIEYFMVNESTAAGVMTLYYEDHVYGVQHAPDSAWYGFFCNMDGNVISPQPKPHTGVWSECHGPHGLTTQPDIAYMPTTLNPEVTHRNPYVCGEDMAGFDTLRRIIDHTTIVMDDKYWFDADPILPPGGLWVRRPGFSESCWAALRVYQEPNFFYAMGWRPRLGRSGLWRFEVYKTPPYGTDILNDHVGVVLDDSWQDVFYSQSEGPFDVWQPVGEPRWLPSGIHKQVYVHNRYASPLPCLTYMDAFRAEWLGYAGDGGASSSAVVLDDETLPVRVMPNPVGRTARISYIVPNGGRVDIAVYDVTGRAVLRAAQGIQRPGIQTATFAVAALPTGTYLARVSVNGVNTTCRFVVCR